MIGTRVPLDLGPCLLFRELSVHSESPLRVQRPQGRRTPQIRNLILCSLVEHTSATATKGGRTRNTTSLLCTTAMVPFPSAAALQQYPVNSLH